MNFTTLQIAREGAVDWLTLDRPAQLNALDETMVDELWRYFDGLYRDESCRVIVLRGAGRAFCAGLDLKARQASGIPQGASTGASDRSLRHVMLKMRSCPQPIIALIHGAACGGGLALALAADIRIAGESARMNVAFVKLGITGCELGTSYFLPRLVGLSVAAELMMTGRFINAARAVATGLVSEMTPDDSMERSARAMTAEMLRASPIGLRMTKETMNIAGRSTDLDAVMQLEEFAQEQCMRGPDFGEAVAAFIDKREPRFSAAR